LTPETGSISTGSPASQCSLCLSAC